MTDKQAHVFEKLTPIADSDLGIYEEALDYVFQSNNEDVKNIALTGAYGAGKSSVLSSYKSKNKEKEFLHISLAHFNEQAEDEIEISPIKESVLEVKILNQLIHQIPSDKIPQTQFKVKKAMGWKKAILRTFLALLFILSTIVFAYFGKWISFIGSLGDGLKSMFMWTTSYNFRFLLGVLVVGLASVLMLQMVKTQKARNLLRKLSVQGNEIEMNTEEDDSFFDKYLNEVLYLFENVSADVIVFEDVDRFETGQIFERLREINTLANLQRKKEGKGVLRFFYLLRDDIFDTKDRTKFFDYIIPIVPVVDSSNSYDQFISHLKKNGLFEKFDERFLQGLSLYVDDMRLLKNICNEFLIYYTRLNTTDLNYNKMLAIITYKNLFPSDYSNLQLKKGFVYALFDHKADFIEARRNDLLEKIRRKQEEIDYANKEHLELVQELEDVYAGRQKRTPSVNWQQAREYEKQLEQWHMNEYPKRKKAIEQKSQGKLAELEKELAELEDEARILSDQPLCFIIDRDNIEEIFSIETTNEVGDAEKYLDVKRNEYFNLLKYLIRNGYIDETYSDYMTYFYANSLSRGDKIFLRSVADKKAKEYTYDLKDPQKVLERLSPLDFDQEETLNFAITDYLVCYKPESSFLIHLVDQIKKNKKYDFIEKYYESTVFKPKWIPVLNQGWPELFSEALNGQKMSSIHIRELSIDTLYYCSDETIQLVNKEGVFAQYISESADYLAIDTPNIERIIHGFQLLNIFFPAIDYNVSESALFEAVYVNGRYELNYANIVMLLTKVYGIHNEDEIRHSMTTMIMENPESPLFKKVQENIKDYIEIVLNECNGRICDDEGVVIEILNNDSIDSSTKEKYIGYSSRIITELAFITDKSLWRPLVANGLIEFSGKNVFDYYLNGKDLDATIVEFVNQAKHPLDFSELDASYNENKGELFGKIVKCNELKDEQYEHALVSLHRIYNKFSIEGVEDSKMLILIDNRIVQMNVENLAYLRALYNTVLTHYIEVNIDEYIDVVTQNKSMFSMSELLVVLSMSDVGDDQKLQLLGLTKESVSIIGRGYGTRVQEYVLKHNMNNKDLPVLYRTYSQQDPLIQTIIFGHAVRDVGQIIQKPTDIDRMLKNKLIRSEDLSSDVKVKLVIADFTNMDQFTLSQNLKAAGKEEFNRLFDPSTRPRFIDTPENQALLKAFQNSGWIDDYYSAEGYLKTHRQEARKKMLVHQ